ncbi:tetratricopeptide repeat protein [Nonomuraea antimicrobica]|uniref:tetratricopeptide repeat protein n=1 Tax=Nonomuraea antimicrobica TaxID=561173 RepID=UPI0031EA2A62
MGDANPYTKAAGLIRLAGASAALGKPDAASHADQALRLARERSFRVMEGLALTALADLAHASGDHAQAVRQAERALEIHRETGHRLGEARTLRTLADALGDPAYRERAMDVFDGLGLPDTHGVVR